jgi:apolipoprotein N-acyltransferase
MKKLTKLVPYEVWWMLVGLNYGLALFGVLLENYSLLGLGIFSALSCSLSAFLCKKSEENE